VKEIGYEGFRCCTITSTASSSGTAATIIIITTAAAAATTTTKNVGSIITTTSTAHVQQVRAALQLRERAIDLGWEDEGGGWRVRVES
jgi:hypothetical protein